jgi:glutaredoxin
MKKAIYYHAGCPVCVSAEEQVLNMIDQNQYDLEVIHLGQNPARIDEAENSGVKSVPALVLEGNVLHINFGAAISDLK